MLEGSTLWFANDFYDGEGLSGVGAIGSFNVNTAEYRMEYLPEIAPWSGSAILLDGDDVWVGLMRRPEGAPYGAGLLRYNRRTGAVLRYPFPDLVHSIDRFGDALYLGTSRGLYLLRGGELTHLRFEPVAEGRWSMVVRRLPAAPAS